MQRLPNVKSLFHDEICVAQSHCAGRKEKTMSDHTIVTNNDVVNEEHNETHHDAKVGGELGGVGGAVTGAIAGSAVGPLGTIAGALIGGVAGALGSSAAVNAVDKIDDDTTISGLGHHTGHVVDNTTATAGTTLHDTHQTVSNTAYNTESNIEQTVGANGLPGVQTGGHAIDGSMAPDTRGMTEKIGRQPDRGSY